MGKKSKENRLFRRYRKDLTARVSDGKDARDVKILDYSLDGVGVIINDALPVDRGDILNVDSDELSMHSSCEVEWLSRTPEGLRVGLRRLTPLCGSLKNFRLADILTGLQRSLKNGVLIVAAGPVEKKVYVRKGDIIFAASNQAEDRLGNILLREGRITQSAFDITSKLMPLTGKKQGALLVEIKAMTPKDLSWAVKHQVVEILMSLFSLNDAKFEFRENAPPAEEVIPLKLPSGHLIYRGLKREGSEGQLREFIELPSDTIIAFSGDPLDLFQDIPFDGEDKKILFCVDGKKTIKDIIDLTGLSEAVVRKSLSVLMNTAIIETVEEEIREKSISFAHIVGRPDPPPELVDKILEMHRGLAERDYYSILGVNNSVPEDELRLAFYRTAREYHPDMHFYLDRDMKARLHAIFEHIVKAYTVLRSPERRLEYDGTLIGRQPGLTRAARAKERFEAGQALFIEGRYDEAARCFEEAVRLDSQEAGYHFYHGLTLNRLNRPKDAERSFARACKISPANDEYLAELGHVYLKLGLTRRAKMSFIKALHANLTNRNAQEGMLSLQ